MIPHPTSPLTPDSPPASVLSWPLIATVSALVGTLIFGGAAWFAVDTAVWIGLILGFFLAVANLFALTRIIGGLLKPGQNKKGFFGLLLALKLLFLGLGIAIGLWVFSADLLALVSAYMAVTIALLLAAGQTAKKV